MSGLALLVCLVCSSAAVLIWLSWGRSALLPGLRSRPILVRHSPCSFCLLVGPIAEWFACACSGGVLCKFAVARVAPCRSVSARELLALFPLFGSFAPCRSVFSAPVVALWFASPGILPSLLVGRSGGLALWFSLAGGCAAWVLPSFKSACERSLQIRPVRSPAKSAYVRSRDHL